MRRRRSALSSSVASLYSDATLALDFENSFYKKDSFTTANFGLLPSLAVSRAGGGYAEDTSGNLVWFPSNVARVTNRGLLIEEARTNLAFWSQSIVGHYAAGTPAGGQWGGFGGAITLPGGTVAGPAPGSVMEQVSFGSATQINIGQRVSVSSSTTYTASVWIATSSGTFDLKLSQTNTVSWASATTSSVITASAVPKRYSITFTTGAGDTLADILIGGESKTPYNLPSTGSIYVWGLQLEAGTSATSYIPTTSSSVTRPRDDVWVTNLPAPPECTFLFEYENPNVVGDNRGISTLWDGTSNNRFRISEYTAGNLEVAVRAGGSGPGAVVPKQGTANRRFGFRNKVGDLRVYLNGIQGEQNTGSLTVPSTANTLTIGTNLIEATPGINSYFKKVVMYSRAYSDAELYVLTAGIDTSSFSLDFSNGIYKNSAGYVRTNLLKRSQDFSNGVWTKANATVASGALAPDGTTTAFTVTATAANAGIYQAITDVTGISSIYVRLRSGVGLVRVRALSAGVTSFVQIGSSWTRLTSPGGTGPYGAVLDILTSGDQIDVWGGQVEATSYPSSYIATGASPVSVTTYASTTPADVGNMTFTRPSSGYAEDAQGNLVLFGANVPRITNKGVLIEESRTNLLLQTSDLNNAVWFLGGAVAPTKTPNYASAPDGTNTAALLSIGSRAAATQAQFLAQTITLGSTNAYSGTWYVKASSPSDVGQQLNVWQYDGAIKNISTITLTGSWQRVSTGIVSTLTAGSNREVCSIGRLSTVDGGVSGTSAVGVLIWGPQGEAGSFPTSYIPTTSAGVTRAADQFYYASGTLPLQNAMSFIANSGPVANTNSARWFFALGADPTNNRIGLVANQTPNTLVGRYVTGGAGKSPGDIIGGVSINDNNIVGLSYAIGSSVKMAGNATLSGTPGGDPTSLPSQTLFAIGAGVDLTSQFNGFIKKFSAYNYGMSDAELTHRTRIIAAYNLLLESNSYLLQENNGLTKLEGYFA